MWEVASVGIITYLLKGDAYSAWMGWILMWRAIYIFIVGGLMNFTRWVDKWVEENSNP